MNTPNWMLDAPANAARRAKMARRHNRRSTDRRVNLDVLLAFGAMLVTSWAVYEVTSLLLHSMLSATTAGGTSAAAIALRPSASASFAAGFGFSAIACVALPTRSG